MATTLVSIGEYLKTTHYEPDAEYVDGVIEERPMGEYDHANWQESLLAWFRANGKQWNVRALAELRVEVAVTRYRIPDVVVIDRSRPKEQILTYPPVAVFEILSPEDTIARMLVKLADYEQMGIRTILVIDPKTQHFYRYEKGSLDLCRHAVEQLVGTEAVVDWDKVTELLD
jgi:Uma2 family endonuclease